MTLPVIVCANVVFDGDNVLLVCELKPSALGRWSLPGGKLHAGETLRAGAEREALEETGLVVEAGPLIGIYHCVETLEGGAAVTFVFRSTVVGGELTTSPSHPEVRFVSPGDFEQLVSSNLIRGRHARAAIDDSRSGHHLPGDTISNTEASDPPLR